MQHPQVVCLSASATSTEYKVEVEKDNFPAIVISGTEKMKLPRQSSHKAFENEMNMFTMTDAEKEGVASRMVNHFHGCCESTFNFLIYKNGKACIVFSALRCSSLALQSSSKLASCPPCSGAMASQPTKKEEKEAKKRPAAKAVAANSPPKTSGLSASATSTDAGTTSLGHGYSSGMVDYPTADA